MRKRHILKELAHPKIQVDLTTYLSSSDPRVNLEKMCPESFSVPEGEAISTVDKVPQFTS